MANKTSIDKQKEFALEVAQEALKLDRIEREKEEKQALFRNTKLLLKNYNNLKEHCENGVWHENPEDEDECSIILHEYKEDAVLESIKRTKARTMMMIAYIETALRILKRNTLKSHTPLKYEALVLMHLDKEYTSVPWLERRRLVAEKINVSESTVNRYTLDMIDELAIILFGLGALKLVK